MATLDERTLTASATENKRALSASGGELRKNVKKLLGDKGETVLRNIVTGKGLVGAKRELEATPLPESAPLSTPPALSNRIDRALSSQPILPENTNGARFFSAREQAPGITEITTPDTTGSRFFTNRIEAGASPRQIADFSQQFSGRAGVTTTPAAQMAAELNPSLTRKFTATSGDGVYGIEPIQQATRLAPGADPRGIAAFRASLGSGQPESYVFDDPNSSQVSPIQRTINEINRRKGEALAQRTSAALEKTRIEQAGELAKERAKLSGYGPDQTIVDGAGNIIRAGQAQPKDYVSDVEGLLKTSRIDDQTGMVINDFDPQKVAQFNTLTGLLPNADQRRVGSLWVESQQRGVPFEALTMLLKNPQLAPDFQAKYGYVPGA